MCEISNFTPLPSIMELLNADTFTHQVPKPTNTITHGSWTAEEDSLLRSAVAKMGTLHWDQIAQYVDGRTATQCRERWLFRLSPGLKKTPFEKWEDEIIISHRKEVGNHWTLIASKLPGRSSCAVKNRWYTVLRKRDNSQMKKMHNANFDLGLREAYSIAALVIE